MSNAPALPRFKVTQQARFADTDMNGHVFFGNYLIYMDEAFMAYLHAIEHTWDDLAKLGLRMYYVDVGCQFKGQARFEDRLDVHCEVTKIGNTSLRAQATIVRPNGGELIATGHIAGVMIDSDTDRPAPVPASFRTAVEKHRSGG